MPELCVSARAKINLFLRVLAREASGYHGIETLFHKLDLADAVVVRTRSDSRRLLQCRGVDVGPIERNLAYRAAEAYQAATGGPSGFEIEIEKEIPPGGGLGGGSADAGAVLRALDAMSSHSVGPARLSAIASTLGADVPFQASEAVCAMAWGRGERMLELHPMPRRAIAVVFPDFGVATADAYRWLAEDRERRGGDAPVGRVWSRDELSDWDALAPLAANDFDAVVMARHSRLGVFRDALRGAGAPIAMLAGSGSSVYGVFADEVSAARGLAAVGIAGRVTNTADH